eukprot:12325166-Heterocapsa_arctica.AAC.1
MTRAGGHGKFLPDFSPSEFLIGKIFMQKPSATHSFRSVLGVQKLILIPFPCPPAQFYSRS